jgi:demethoxyubiquinone hydroxylase (CLK1/Coq7/Cat5 family)
MKLDETIRQRLITFQRIEVTEHHIYQRLAKVIRPAENQHILEQIAQDELRHYQDWKRYTGQEVRPDQMKIWLYYWVSGRSVLRDWLPDPHLPGDRGVSPQTS